MTFEIFKNINLICSLGTLIFWLEISRSVYRSEMVHITLLFSSQKHPFMNKSKH